MMVASTSEPASADNGAPIAVIERVVIERGSSTTIGIDHLELNCGSTALVGPNGSGKSTLLHLIAGMIEPVTGTVTVLGRSPTDARRDVAYVMQSQATSPHLPVTAREVVSLGRAARLGPFRRLAASDRAAVSDAMERLEVADLADRQLSEMSGGQRQRVLVAQGIAQEADLLLLDEPVAGVDLASIATIGRVIEQERSAGRTVIVATHDLAEAGGYDCVVLLAGRRIASGPAGEVLTMDNLRAAYGARLLGIGDADLLVDDEHHHDHDHDHDHDHGQDHGDGDQLGGEGSDRDRSESPSDQLGRRTHHERDST